MWKSLFVVAIIASAHACRWHLATDSVQVDIDKGTLCGFGTTSWRGTPFSAFKGIPYAKPPVGDLRFKGPEEEIAWAGEREATSHGSMCPQLIVATNIFWGEEDCLFLNVYSPNVTAEGLPVMVWVHGGGFHQGSSNTGLYSPDYFMEAGVVLVTVNYRLGALGFLSTGDDGAPGNAGLKDQVAALRWVRRNIAKFGGDPDNVTLFGESAGGASTHFHLLSPMSSGLFARAIGQSGSSLNAKSLTLNAANVTVRLAQALGAQVGAGETAKALEFLKTASSEDIVKVQGNLKTPEEERLGVSSLFTPSVDAASNPTEVFLPDLPLRLLKSGSFNRVPYLTGHTSAEGLLFYDTIIDSQTMKAATEDTERFVPRDITNDELRGELANSIRKFYFNDEPVGYGNITNLVNLYTDTFYVAGTNRATQFQLQANYAPLYYYVFAYEGGLNLLKNLRRIQLPGASHADDLGYLFYSKLLFWRKPAIGSEDEFVLDTMVRLWTNFAKYGNPTPPGDPLVWKPATVHSFQYLNISGKDTQLGVNPDPERTRFWAEAYEKDSKLRN